MRAQTGKRDWGGRVVILLPYLWLGDLLSCAVCHRAQDQPVTDRPGAAALFTGVRFDGRLAGLKDFAAQLSAELVRVAYHPTRFICCLISRACRWRQSPPLFCLALGYPIAYGMARAPQAWQPLLVMAVVLPFWTSFLIRIYAWINILQRDGLLNDVLMRLHVIDTPAAWLSSDTAIYIGIVYSYLPFMVLPLYAALEKMDETLLEAAADLGCPRVEIVLAGDVAAVAAGRRCRRAALLHPDCRRIRHS